MIIVIKFLGTPQTKTPIRKRRFNTPVFDLTTPCQGALSDLVDTKRTFAPSATENTSAEDISLTNTCISLTEKFEALSPAAESVKTIGESSTGQRPNAPTIVTSGVQPNRKNITPLREPLLLTDSTSPAMLQTPINLNKSSKFTVKSSTPHLRISCWTDKPTLEDTKGKMCSARPLRVSNSFDVSGMLPLQQTPADKEQYVKPVSQVFFSPIPVKKIFCSGGCEVVAIWHSQYSCLNRVSASVVLPATDCSVCLVTRHNMGAYSIA